MAARRTRKGPSPGRPLPRGGARARHVPEEPRLDRSVRTALVGMFTAAAIIHVWVSLTTPEVYAGFAETSPWTWVQDAWQRWYVPNTVPASIALAVFQFAVAGLLLVGGRAALIGLAAGAVFTAVLVAFGWWYLLWSVPVIALMAWLALRTDQRIRG